MFSKQFSLILSRKQHRVEDKPLPATNIKTLPANC